MLEWLSTTIAENRTSRRAWTLEYGQLLLLFEHKDGNRVLGSQWKPH